MDKDREAFEEWVNVRWHHVTDKPDLRGVTNRWTGKWCYTYAETSSLYAAWQAARDHYTPKMTEKEAVDAAAVAIYEANRERNWPNRFEDAHAAIRTGILTAAKVALRAAGARFKEEA